VFGKEDQVVGDENEDDSQLEFINVGDVLEQGNLEEDIHLPPHVRCSAHTLNLVAGKDSEKALSNTGYAKISRGRCYERCAKKCQSPTGLVQLDLGQ